mgnify:CR=1 FL=1
MSNRDTILDSFKTLLGNISVANGYNTDVQKVERKMLYWDVEEAFPVGKGVLYLAFEQLKEELRKKGYFDLISLGRTFLIALFNFVIMLSLISFIFNPVSFFSFPFILYSVGSFIKCTRVAKSSSNISFLFYFPIYLFISVVDRILTCHVLVKKALGFNNQEVHFKGERK